MVTMGVFPFQGKTHMVELGIEPVDLMVSSQELWPPSHINLIFSMKNNGLFLPKIGLSTPMNYQSLYIFLLSNHIIVFYKIWYEM